MDNLFLEVFNEGFSPAEMNAVRGGTAEPLCRCNNGATYDCGCLDDCTCNGPGSSLTCSCNTINNRPPCREDGEPAQPPCTQVKQ